MVYKLYVYARNRKKNNDNNICGHYLITIYLHAEEIGFVNPPASCVVFTKQ